MKFLAFDLGDTLVEYEGLPLSWEIHYPAAIQRLATSIHIVASESQVEQCCAVLRKYNTRLHPRENEVSFSKIAEQLFAVLGFNGSVDEVACAESFFSVFRQKLRAFPDSLPALQKAISNGQRIGVFTDVPYGMPRELVEEDIQVSGLSGGLGLMVTSRDAGFRKPHPMTLRTLATMLGCGAQEMLYVGNERKDIQVALAFGCEAVLLDRNSQNPAWGQHRTIRSLAEL